jgi:calcineurin-like phosphoesterase family protein
MIETYVGSDHHFFHKNIIEYCNRPFVELGQMHHFMIEEWNSVVTPEDIYIHLGDFICGGSREEVMEVVSQLNGYKILVLGNHDRHGKQWFLDVGFDQVYKSKFCMGMYCFSHRVQHADFLDANGSRYNLHGHSHKHDYGDPYFNFGVDVVGYKPKKVKFDIEREDLLQGNVNNMVYPPIIDKRRLDG